MLEIQPSVIQVLLQELTAYLRDKQVTRQVHYGVPRIYNREQRALWEHIREAHSNIVFWKGFPEQARKPRE